jgi:CSLREA domain-containing protein
MNIFIRQLSQFRRRLSVRILLVLAPTLILASSLPVRTGQSSSAVRRGIGVAAPLPAATTFTVNSVADTADTNIGDGHCDTDGNLGNGDQCTLRAAIQEGQVGNQGHSISFNLPANSVITLNTALPTFQGNVTIVGPGSSQLTIQRSTADGTPDFTIFSFAPINGNFTDTISGLTLANGKNTASGSFPTGGCLFNLEFDVVTVTDVTFRGCTGLNGGAINNGGTLTLTDSTIDGNTASGGAGGGIYNTSGGFNGDGTLNLIRTTVSNNSANAQGGAIANVSSGVVTLTN